MHPMGTLGFPTICVEHPFLSVNHPRILWMLKIRSLEKSMPCREKYYPVVMSKYLLKIAIYSEFSHSTWRFSMVMLVY